MAGEWLLLTEWQVQPHARGSCVGGSSAGLGLLWMIRVWREEVSGRICPPAGKIKSDFTLGFCSIDYNLLLAGDEFRTLWHFTERSPEQDACVSHWAVLEGNHCTVSANGNRGVYRKAYDRANLDAIPRVVSAITGFSIIEPLMEAKRSAATAGQGRSHRREKVNFDSTVVVRIMRPGPVWRNPLATGLLESLPFLHEHAAIPSTAAYPEPLKT